MDPIKVELADRYAATLTEYQGNLYLHINDFRIKKGQGVRQVSLHAEAVLALESQLPVFTECIRSYTKNQENTDKKKL